MANSNGGLDLQRTLRTLQDVVSRLNEELSAANNNGLGAEIVQAVRGLSDEMSNGSMHDMSKKKKKKKKKKKECDNHGKGKPCSGNGGTNNPPALGSNARFVVSD